VSRLLPDAGKEQCNDLEHGTGCRGAAEPSLPKRRTTVVSESIVVIRKIAVMFVAGDRTKPISEQAPAAFETLEDKLTTLRGDTSMASSRMSSTAPAWLR
jgi:hypothetical protein